MNVNPDKIKKVKKNKNKNKKRSSNNNRKYKFTQEDNLKYYLKMKQLCGVTPSEIIMFALFTPKQWWKNKPVNNLALNSMSRFKARCIESFIRARTFLYTNAKRDGVKKDPIERTRMFICRHIGKCHPLTKTDFI